MSIARFRVAAVLFAALFGACGGDVSGPSGPAALEIVSGDRQSATAGSKLGEPVVVRVRDSRGNPLGNVRMRVQFTGGGQVDLSYAVSDAAGLAQVKWWVGHSTSDEQTLTLHIEEGAVPAVTFHATAVAGAALAVRLLDPLPTSVRSGDIMPQQPVVGLVDLYGNIVSLPNVAVTVSLLGDTRRMLRGPTTVLTGADGIARFSALSISGEAGPIALWFDAPPRLGVATTSQLIAGAAARLTAASSTELTGIVSSADLSAKVRVSDEFGNGVAGVDVRFTYAAANQTATVKSDATGVATYSGWTVPGEVGRYPIVASSAGLSDVAFTIVAKGRPPARLVPVTELFEGGEAGDTGPDLGVRAIDELGYLVVGEPIQFAYSNGTAIKTVVTNGEGVAMLAGWQLPSAVALYTVVASHPAATSSVRFSVGVVVGAASRLEPISFPTSGSPSSTQAIVARVTDAGGNRVPNAVVAWMPMTLGISFGSGLTVSDDSAIVRTTITLPAVAGDGRFRVTFQSGRTREYTITTLTGAFDRFEPAVISTTVTVGSRFTANFRTVDRSGNAVANVPVFAYPASPPQLSALSPASQQSDAFGRIAFSGTAGATPGVEEFRFYTTNGTTGLVRVTVVP